jgi:hypothetical protein
MKQIPLDLPRPVEPHRVPEVALPDETIESVIALMARLLGAVVRAAREPADER